MTIEPTSKILALEQVAQALTDSGVKWAVCHGLENYPENIGRDLDIIVEAPKLIDAVRTTCHCLRHHGWTVLPNLQGWVWWIVAFRPEIGGGIASLQIDLFDHLQWAFTWVVDGPGTDTPLTQRGPFLEDRSACLGKTLILNGLSRGYQAFKNKPHYLNLSDEDASTLIPLLHRISDLDPFETIDGLRSESPCLVDDTFMRLRASARIKSFRSPGKWRRLKSAILKQWVVNLFPKKGAPVIVIWGEGIESWTDLIVETFSSLVFYQTILYKEYPNSFKQCHVQRRQSCLQCVSVYSNSFKPHNINPDLIIESFNCGRAKLSITSDDSMIELCSPDKINQFHEALICFFRAQGCYLLSNYHIH